MGVPLRAVILVSFLVSVMLLTLTWLGFGSIASATAVAVACLLIGLVQYSYGGTGSAVKPIPLWALLVCLPMVALFAVNQVVLSGNRQWMLLLLGPASFLLAQTVIIVCLNIFRPGVHE